MDSRIKVVPILNDDLTLAGIVTAQSLRQSAEKTVVIRSKSPVRISFSGGGTDTSSYFMKNSGAVLNATINLFAHATYWSINCEHSETSLLPSLLLLKHLTTNASSDVHGACSLLNIFAADDEEPGEQMIGATFSQEFPKLGVLTAKVTEYTPPKVKGVNDVSDIETKGLYKVVFSDGDYGQYYYSDLLKHGAKIPDDKEKSDL